MGRIDLVLPSNIQAIEEATIYARTNGYVRERYVDIGAPVTAAVLARRDTPELDQEPASPARWPRRAWSRSLEPYPGAGEPSRRAPARQSKANELLPRSPPNAVLRSSRRGSRRRREENGAGRGSAITAVSSQRRRGGEPAPASAEARAIAAARANVRAAALQLSGRSRRRSPGSLRRASTGARSPRERRRGCSAAHVAAPLPTPDVVR
jgi:hypothetical protein